MAEDQPPALQVPAIESRGLKRKTSLERANEIIAKRKRLLEHFKAITARQDSHERLDPNKVAFNRRPVSEAIPLAILHPIFGHFIEEKDTYQPTHVDNALVRELRDVMSTTQLQHCREFHRVLSRHYSDIQLQASRIDSTEYICNGHVNVGNLMSLVSERTGDPEIEAPGYSITSAREKFEREGDYPDKFPCMIVYNIGSFVCFAGAVLTDRVHLETLTTALPMDTNRYENDIADQTACVFGAFRRAIRSLKTYYRELAVKKKRLFVSERYEDLLYPYRCHYSRENNEKVGFRYIQRLYDRKLLFLCQDTLGQNLCVKFTKKYSEAAHRHCADLGVAPKVYDVEQLPGGWKMVVMEYLDDEIYRHLRVSRDDREALAKEVQRVIDILHQGNFVHGDVRDVNIMMIRDWNTTDDKRKVLLIDFDWAGPKDTARYPANVNTRDFFRPEGATDGELITQEHDIAMFKSIFE